jgi:hypothetical protein
VYEAAPAADEATRAAVAAMLARIFFIVEYLPRVMTFAPCNKQTPCQILKSLIFQDIRSPRRGSA